jgi:hypothetical protein
MDFSKGVIDNYNVSVMPFFNLKSMINRLLSTGATNNQHWLNIVKYVYSCTDVRKSICVGCGKGALRDNAGIGYQFSQKNTMEEMEALVLKVREINKAV